MVRKDKLQDKQVVFRLISMPRIYSGTVKIIEPDGFWIESPDMVAEMLEDDGWKKVVGGVQAPILFVPTSSLYYLIAPGSKLL